MRGETRPFPLPAALPLSLGSGWFKRIAFLYSARMVKWIERSLPVANWLINWYGDRVYRRMLERELALAQLQPGVRVLHIGAGALPYTALFLARRGHIVDAIDHDARTLGRAKRLLREAGAADRVRVRELDGLRVDATGYAAIWISLHVWPKEDLLDHLVRTSDPGSVIICREPRGWLTSFYHRSRRRSGRSGQEQAMCRHRLGKQSVLIRVNCATAAREQAS